MCREAFRMVQGRIRLIDDCPGRGASLVADADFLSIVTPRLTLRRLRPTDLHALVSYRAQHEVARFQDWDGFS